MAPGTHGPLTHQFAARYLAGWLLILSLTLGATLGLQPVRANQACVQPSPDGCPLDLGQPVLATISDSVEFHLWWLTIPSPGEIRVALADPAYYRLYVYSPDGSLAGVSSTGSGREEISAQATAAGAYQVVVDSPRGQVSETPYRLLAVRPGSILLSDTFDDPASGVFPLSSGQPDQWEGGYADGEYQLRRITRPGIASARLPGIYSESGVRLSGCMNTPWGFAFHSVVQNGFSLPRTSGLDACGLRRCRCLTDASAYSGSSSG